MVTLERFTYRPAKGPQELTFAIRYREKHPVRPEDAVAQSWFVVESDGDIVANMGAIDQGPCICLTDIYCEPSRRGIEAAKFVLAQVARAIDNGRWKQAFTSEGNERSARWLQAAGFRPFKLHVYGGLN